MFGILGNFIIKRSAWLLGLGVVLMIAGGVYGSTVFSHLSGGGFGDPKSESYKAAATIDKEFGNQLGTLIVQFRSSNGLKATDPAYQDAVTQSLKVAKTDPNVKSVVDNYSAPNPAMISRDGTSTYAVIQLKGSLDEITDASKELRPKLGSDVLDVKTGGGAAINEDINTQISEDLSRSETISFILLGILLVLVFRSFVAALLPLFLGGLGVLGAFLIVRLLTEVMDISQYAINVIILLGLGLSIDYSLFMVSRFREELRRGHDSKLALSRTMHTAGRTVFFSGITVIVSLLGLMVFPTNFFRSMGLGGAAAVAVAMLSAITILPAALVRLGNRVNWLSFGKARADYDAINGTKSVIEEKESFWHRAASWAMRRPILAIALIVIPFLLVGQLFLQAKFANADYRSLSEKSESRQVTESLRKDFPGGASGDPIQVVLHTDDNTDAPATGGLLATYALELKQLPGVTGVDISGATDHYVLMHVSYNSDYDELLARDLVKKVRALNPPAHSSAQVGGPTAELVDILATLRHYAPYAGGFVVITLLVLLFLMLGSVVVPLQAIFVNVLSLSATFGVLVWVFQKGHLEGLLGFSSVGSIDATDPVLIFGIAFGLSMDYAVFLLSRIKEEYDHSNDPIESVKEGVQKTGTIITSAALLLIVVVAAFATSSIPLIKQIGIGLGCAIFFDAFIIRMLLVPSLMRLFGHNNWWAPAPLRRLSKWTGLQEKS